MTDTSNEALDEMVEALKDMGLKKAAAMVIALRQERDKARTAEFEALAEHLECRVDLRNARTVTLEKVKEIGAWLADDELAEKIVQELDLTIQDSEPKGFDLQKDIDDQARAAGATPLRTVTQRQFNELVILLETYTKGSVDESYLVLASRIIDCLRLKATKDSEPDVDPLLTLGNKAKPYIENMKRGDFSGYERLKRMSDSEPGRECPCPEVVSEKYGHEGFDCRKAGHYVVPQRCTLRDGETDQ